MTGGNGGSVSGKIRVLLKDSVIYGLGGVLSRFISFFLLPVYTRVFAPSDYGIMELISTLVSIVSVSLILGTDSALAFHFYKTPSDTDRRETISSLLFFETLVGGVIAAISFLFAPWIGRTLLQVGNLEWIIRIAALSIVQGMILSLVQLILRVERRSVHYSALVIASLLLNIALTLATVVGLRMGLAGVYISKLVSDSLAVLLGLYLIRRWLAPKFSGERVRSLLRYGIPLVPATIAIWVISYVDRYFLQYYASMTDLGLYSVANRIASAMSLLVSAFQLGWGPFAFSIQHDPTARATYAKVLDLFLAVTCLAATGLSVFTPGLLRILTPGSYQAAWIAVPWLAFSFVLSGTSYVVSIGVNLSEKTKYISWTTTVSAVVNVALNFVLIPRWGLMGAAAATLAAQFVGAALLYVASQRFYPIPYQLFRAAGLLLASGVVTAAGLAVPEGSPLSLPSKLAALGILLAVFLRMGVVERSWIRRLFPIT